MILELNPNGQWSRLSRAYLRTSGVDVEPEGCGFADHALRLYDGVGLGNDARQVWNLDSEASRMEPRRSAVCSRYGRSRRTFSRARSFRFARRIAAAISGATSLEKPLGSPRLRSVMRVLLALKASQV
jgi:hypothetical protein